MAQFRAGITPLKIEVGRYYRIPLEFRICTLCNYNVVEDEKHFLLECSKYISVRVILLKHILEEYPSFFNMSSEEQLYHIFSNEKIIEHLVNYLHSALEIRRGVVTRVTF